MTVTALKTRVSYTGDASTVDFAFDMRIRKDADIYVYLDTVKQSTGYEVLGGMIQDGIVQFAAAPNSGVVIDIVRVPDWLQEMDLISGGMNPDSVEYSIDHLVHLLQHIKDRLDRMLQYSLLSTTTELELPEPVANTAIGYNNAGTALVNLVADAVCSAAFLKDCSIPFENTAYFDAEVDNGNSGTTDIINWTKGNKQKSTLTGNCTFTFVPPGGACNLILRLIQDSTGSRTVTWPKNIRWPARTEPAITTTGGAIDLISFFFDGKYYWGCSLLNMAVIYETVLNEPTKVSESVTVSIV